MGAGHKRHLVVDCLASIHLVWADDGYAGRLVDWAAEKWGLTLQIVKRSDDTAGSWCCRASRRPPRPWRGCGWR
ncbi:hypothetical protein AB0E64_02000 [Streptomyces caelestis]|jgi:hypothetical protein|uniref:Transposase IS4-like domain-containing protein n=1 Tax=Streptomyces caelestis TaxID=36816 RepID=A0A7W9HAV1_9ACTN|nr:hypothetical protein [Streptomyces caelestis]MBB5798616.1 hypothetical protein [Streptomyces caelestis]GGW51642.1 hypothetical protein GCM10010320_35510 [Streptomyces caelestis]